MLHLNRYSKGRSIVYVLDDTVTPLVPQLFVLEAETALEFERWLTSGAINGRYTLGNEEDSLILSPKTDRDLFYSVYGSQLVPYRPKLGKPIVAYT